MVLLSSLSDPQLVELLLSGRVGVIPTDTIYGLAAVADNKEAVANLYRLKHRGHKPGTIIAASIEQLIKLGLSEGALRSVGHLWPNPLSIVIPSAQNLDYLDQGLKSLAVRIPKHETLQALLEKTGPLLTSSANHPQQPPANNVGHAQDYFGETVDFYVDGGDLSGHPPSTVARLSEGHLEVLRNGAVTIDAAGKIL